jgi:chromosome transmission fidelity protein 4
VRSHSSEEESSLDVEFHDVAVHHSLHLPNPEGAITMAALGTGLLALASPDKLTVNYFSSSDLSKEWSLPMEEGETVLGLAVGEGWVALATSRHFLR